MINGAQAAGAGNGAIDHTLLNNLHQFMRALRGAGLPVSHTQMADAAQALTLIELAHRGEVYHALRCQLVLRREHARIFDALFAQFFSLIELRQPRTQAMPRAPRHKRPDLPFDVSTYMAYKARLFDQELEVTDRSRTHSAVETIQSKDFSSLTPEEVDTLRELMQHMNWNMARRITRRRIEQRNGDTLHLRGVIRRSARTGGVPLSLAWQRRKIKPRPLVLICDISGSMDKYSRIMLMFFHCVAARMRDVRAFVFGTRLTEITHALTLRNMDVALDEAARDVVDWNGGTRIGDSLAHFNRHFARRALRRGAVVLVVSDGWERGDVSQLRDEMRHLQHRAHRVIWLNPLSGAEGYAPEVEGMRAALPHIDDFLPMHNLHSLKEVNRRLAQLK